MSMEREVPEKTPLDEALETAKQDKKQAALFYDTFLNADLFVPVEIAGAVPSWKKVGMQDKFHPMFVPSGENKVVPAFDRFERLREWSDGRAIDYLELKAHIFLRLLGGGVSLCLNAGTDFAYVFTPEIIERLRNSMKAVRPT
jgi:hypothetical protein